MLNSLHPLIRLAVLVFSVSVLTRPVLETFAVDSAQAQTTSPADTFPLPASLPTGAALRVDGSSSMELINQALRERFLERFPGTTVDLAANGSDEAIEALLDGAVNLAAVGRPLTAEEQGEGLKLIPVSREKIAIIVGESNPFEANLTFDQFAQIFRGEITDWSEVGGEPGPIRFIDRPEESDTRRSLSTYDVFKTAPFENGDTTTRVANDTTDAVVDELGTDGIGYAIADQVLDRPGVRVLEMHGTLPDDPRYPYSQPRGYVYQEGVTDPAALAFLGFATSEPGQEIVEQARAAETASPSPAAAVSPSPVPASPTPAVVASPSPVAEADTALAPAAAADPSGRGFPWWWLLLLGLPLLGGLLWLLKGRGGAAAPTVATVPPVPAPVPPPVPAAAPAIAPIPVANTYDSRIILTPRDCRHAYAYWEVSDQHKADLQRQGGRDLILRLLDVTGVDLDRLEADRIQDYVVKELACDAADRDRHLPIEQDDRDYRVDLGYRTEDGRWLSLAHSAPVRVPACPPVEDKGINVGGVALAGGAAALGAAALARSYPVPPSPEPVKAGSRIILTPRNYKDAYAFWEADEADKAELRRQGGKKMMLRLYDVTDIDMDQQYPHGVQQFDVDEADQDRHLPIPVSDRDYVVEVGYVTEEGRWLKLARSNHVRVPSDLALQELGAVAGGAAVAIAGGGLAAQALAPDRGTEPAEMTPPAIVEPPVVEEPPSVVEGAPEVQALTPSVTEPSGATLPAGVEPQPSVGVSSMVAGGVGLMESEREGDRAIALPPVPRPDGTCTIQNLVVHSRQNCYQITADQMQQLAHHTAVTKALERGSYVIRIKDGLFGYRSESETKGEPIVLLWIHGGQVINRKTDVAVRSTWSTLNGYDETLCLEVLEPTTLHAFFFDTFAQDNNTDVTVSVIRYASPE